MTQVTEHLQTHGVPFTLIAHPQADTSIAEARAIGIEASEVVKTVAVRAAGGYALMAVPATGRLDRHLVQAAVGDRHARLAHRGGTAAGLPRRRAGRLPPLGSLLGAPPSPSRAVICTAGRLTCDIRPIGAASPD